MSTDQHYEHKHPCYRYVDKVTPRRTIRNGLRTKATREQSTATCLLFFANILTTLKPPESFAGVAQYRLRQNSEADNHDTDVLTPAVQSGEGFCCPCFAVPMLFHNIHSRWSISKDRLCRSGDDGTSARGTNGDGSRTTSYRI